jgi:hypothetical protein
MVACGERARGVRFPAHSWSRPAILTRWPAFPDFRTEPSSLSAAAGPWLDGTSQLAAIELIARLAAADSLGLTRPITTAPWLQRTARDLVIGPIAARRASPL